MAGSLLIWLGTGYMSEVRVPGKVPSGGGE